MNPIDKILAKKGKSRTDYKPNSRLGAAFRNQGVANTAELQRIRALPFYSWQEDDDLQDVIEYLNEELGRPEKECDLKCLCKGKGSMSLRPLQAAALSAIHDFGGLLAPIRVGGGKTLISYLAGPILESKRTILLIPAKLRKKTEKEFAKLSRHWVGPKRLHIMSYELLSRDRGVAELTAFAPDLIVCDEAHKLKNRKAACTIRVARYMKEYPETNYIDMSGTITKRSLMEFYHRQKWALPEPLRPLPRKYNEARDWADALDEKVSPTGRLMPGALLSLSRTEEDFSTLSKAEQIKRAREIYRDRLTTAPGVIATREMFDGAMSLIIQGVSWVLNEKVDEAFYTLREMWTLPDGQPIDEPARLWQAARCLVQGFYYKWDPPPPKEWMRARRDWARFTREALKRYRDLDSPLMVARAVEKGRLDHGKIYLKAWQNIRGIYTPNIVAEWLDDSAMNYCLKWAKKNTGIVWVSEVAMGEALHKKGLPYYGRKGLCGKKMIEDESGSCCASIWANNEGRNLQQFNKCLVAGPPPGGAVWEQMLGRIHRDGQEADEIQVDVAIGCYENWKVFHQALRDAEYAESTTGQYQKLNFADIEMLSPEEVVMQKGWAWAKDNADFFDRDIAWTENEIQVSSLSIEQRAQRRRDHYAGVENA